MKLAAAVMSGLTILMTAHAAERKLERVSISVNPKVLKTALQPNVSGTLTLKAIDSNGAEQILPLSDAMITVKTKDACGGVTVAVVENGKVIPKEATSSRPLPKRERCHMRTPEA